MQLIPIKERLEENKEFLTNPLCLEILEMTVDFYKIAGFVPPWIGYFAEKDGELVGSAGFKGKPVKGTIEIAYGTFEQNRNKGIGTDICRKLVELTLKTDPSLRITARTLPENNFSSRILEKNNFFLAGTVFDQEDGYVWEWEFKHNISSDC
jgi:RimJ/RimL family protein N-acetyltransferase